jgi:hypothetical protein
MTNALRAGFGYFLLVFALGFALGTLRVLVTAPALGEITAVAIEIPVILAAAWPTCRWLTRRLAVSAAALPRLVMGAAALALTLAAELALAIVMFGRTPAEHLATYATAPGLLGLSAQLLFAALPLLQRPRP